MLGGRIAYGPDVMLLQKGDIFFGLVECCVGAGSEDIDAGFSLSVCVVYMCFERDSPVICDGMSLRVWWPGLQ